MLNTQRSNLLAFACDLRVRGRYTCPHRLTLSKTIVNRKVLKAMLRVIMVRVGVNTLRSHQPTKPLLQATSTWRRKSRAAMAHRLRDPLL